MKGDKKVIQYFNKVFCNEFIVINQYFFYLCMYKDWGIIKLVVKEYEEFIDEMKYVD